MIPRPNGDSVHDGLRNYAQEAYSDMIKLGILQNLTNRFNEIGSALKLGSDIGKVIINNQHDLEVFVCGDFVYSERNGICSIDKVTVEVGDHRIPLNDFLLENNLQDNTRIFQDEKEDDRTRVLEFPQVIELVQKVIVNRAMDSLREHKAAEEVEFYKCFELIEIVNGNAGINTPREKAILAEVAEIKRELDIPEDKYETGVDRLFTVRKSWLWEKLYDLFNDLKRGRKTGVWTILFEDEAKDQLNLVKGYFQNLPQFICEVDSAVIDRKLTPSDFASMTLQEIVTAESIRIKFVE